MSLPELEYYDLEDLSKRWGICIKQMMHYVETGKIACFSRLRPCWVESGALLKQLNGPEEFHSNHKYWHSGLVRLIPDDCHWVFRFGKFSFLRFISIEKEDCYLQICEDQSAQIIEKNDLVILTNEVERFEQHYLMRECNYPRKSGNILTFADKHFFHSNDYQTVSINGHSFRFGMVQAAIICQLHEASFSDQPWVHGKILLDKAGSRSQQLKNVFCRKANWREAIESDGRGYYRLKL